MNVYELDSMTLTFIRMPQDDDLRREHSPLFLLSYNEFYRKIIREMYRPFHRETVTLDKNTDKRYGLFSLSGLAKNIMSVKEIRTGYGEVYPTSNTERYDTDRMAVLYPVEDTAEAVYFYMPPLLSNPSPTNAPSAVSETNTPVFPAEYHHALCAWAAYRYYKKEGQQAMEQSYYMDAMTTFAEIGGHSGLGSIDAGSVKIRVNFNE